MIFVLFHVLSFSFSFLFWSNLTPTLWPLVISLCHFWENCLSHLRKAVLTVLKKTKIAEQEVNVRCYFGLWCHQSITIQLSKCCLQVCLGLWYFNWLASVWCLRMINSQNTFSLLKSSWLKRHMFQSWMEVIINWPKCRSDGFLRERASFGPSSLFEAWKANCSMHTWLSPLISSFAE